MRQRPELKSKLKVICVVGCISLMGLSARGANDPMAVQKNINAGFGCADLQKATLKIGVFAKNIENRDTTRTAEGGPYKRVDTTCHELFCETTAKADFKLMYAPSHPDANGAGYVQMPHVDVPQQFASLSTAAAEIRLLAQNGTCGASAIANSTMAMIKYGELSLVQADTFTYANDGHLSSWTRLEKNGTSKSYAFGSDGVTLK